MVNRFTVDINLAYQFYLANSVHFQVLEYLFFHPQTEMEEVLEHFFMSYPTFYRTIRRINRWFNGLYNIQVSTKSGMKMKSASSLVSTLRNATLLLHGLLTISKKPM